MQKFFAPNIDNKGRIFRALIAVLLFVGAWLTLRVSLWLCILLAANGVFAVFEALRGWCALRACGIKTRL
jgi:hypothetical protein